MAAQQDSGKPSAFAAKRRKWQRSWQKWRELIAVSKRFTPYLQGRMGMLATAFFAANGYMLMRILEPWPLKLIIDNVLLDSPAPWFLPTVWVAVEGDPMLLLYVLIASIIVIAFGRGFFYFHQRMMTARLGIAIVAELRLDLYKHIQRLPLEFHTTRRTGDLIVRLTSDIRILRQAFVALPLRLLEAVLLILGMTVIMAFMDWQLTILALVLLPVLAVLVRGYHRPIKRAARQQRQREGNIATMASEALGAINVVQGFRRERHEIRRFGGANRGSQRSEVKAARYSALLQWWSEIAIAVTTAVIIGLATHRILDQALSPGDLIVFVAYMRSFVQPLRRITQSTVRVARSAAAGERILQILDTEPAVKDLPDAVAAGSFAGDICFENVSFGYDKRKSALADFSLHIEPGQSVAIVGPTGAGKSTVVNLIPRFYDPDKGGVSIDGHDIRGYTLSSLRKQISLVFQEPVLFATSIAENIAYGKPDASTEDIEAAAKRAGIDHHIDRLRDGYDTVVGERGGTLSGGQRQCIAIARAMIHQAPIIILDEPTTGLDAESAELVLQALKQLMIGKTAIMISHDIRNVRDADRVIVIRNGQIVDDGEPEVLLARDGFLRMVEEKQAG
jgi:ABC-type multidrug transport system fused ATPase/permease subunit